METKPNESAFPIVDEAAGLTKREYFAGLALQGLLANPAYVDYTTLETSAVEAAEKLIAALNGCATAPVSVTARDIADDEAIQLGVKLGYIIGDDWTEWEVFLRTLFKSANTMSQLTDAEHSQWLSTLRAMERACEVAKRKEGVTA
jgi:hypothetical protein